VPPLTVRRCPRCLSISASGRPHHHHVYPALCEPWQQQTRGGLRHTSSVACAPQIGGRASPALCDGEICSGSQFTLLQYPVARCDNLLAQLARHRVTRHIRTTAVLLPLPSCHLPGCLIDDSLHTRDGKAAATRADRRTPAHLPFLCVASNLCVTAVIVFGSPTSTSELASVCVRYQRSPKIPDPCLQPRLHPPNGRARTAKSSNRPAFRNRRSSLRT